jgi:hypothetical protein
LGNSELREVFTSVSHLNYKKSDWSKDIKINPEWYEEIDVDIFDITNEFIIKQYLIKKVSKVSSLFII